MSRVVLQVPMSKDLKVEAEKAALAMGFSSLQDYIRLFLKKTLKGEVGVSIEQFPAVKLSAKNAKRYDKMVEDVLSGKVKVKKYTDVDEMLYDLEKWLLLNFIKSLEKLGLTEHEAKTYLALVEHGSQAVGELTKNYVLLHVN